MDLRDETGALFLASVEVDDPVIMLTRAHASMPPDPRRSGVRLTLLFECSHDIDALLQRLGQRVNGLRADRGPAVGSSRFHRVRPDGYHVTIARPLEA
jgi:hypothetical protein